MSTLGSQLRRATAAILIAVGLAGAQQAAKPPVSGGRVAGELVASAVGMGLSLVVADRIAKAKCGRRTDPAPANDARCRGPVFLVGFLAAGAAAGTGAWLVSRSAGQSSSFGTDVAAGTGGVIFGMALGVPRPNPFRQKGVVAFIRRWAVLITPVATTIAATATRENR